MKNEFRFAQNLRAYVVMPAGFGHYLTRAAIVGALSMHRLLGTRMGDGRVATMGRFYDQMKSQHEVLFESLHRKLRPPTQSVRNLPSWYARGIAGHFIPRRKLT